MTRTIEWDGKKIMKPGLYSRIPLDVYHSQDICEGNSVSSSDLRKAFLESMAHAYAKWSGNPDRDEEDEDKPHFIIGRAMHHLMLGEPFFAKLFAERPDSYEDAKTGEIKPWHGSSAVCKEWLASQAKHGRAVLTGEDIVNVRGMARALSRHHFVAHAGLLNGLIERSIFWRDEPTGLWLKSRPDNIPPSSGDFIDLKTTKSVQWFEMQRTIMDRGYFQQGALVCRAAREVLGIENPTFTLIFVEKKNPWCTRVVELKSGDLDRGEKANRIAMDSFAACIRAGRWPGPGGDKEDARPIEMTERAQKMVDDRIDLGPF